MNAYIRILVLVVLLIVGILAGFMSSAQQISSTTGVAPTTEDLPLFLNGSSVGSVANTALLENRLRSFHDKLPDTNVADGSLPNIGRLVLVPDDRISMVQLGKIWGNIYDTFGPPTFERISLWTGSACDENPSGTRNAAPVFVLSNKSASREELENITANEGCSLDSRVFVTQPRSQYSRRLVKGYRTSYTSLEIGASGSYLLNEQARNPQHRVHLQANLNHPSYSRKVDSAPVVQRRVEPGSLEKEVNSWIERRVTEGSQELRWPSDADRSSVILPIVINGNASYSTLTPILRLLRQRKDVRLYIVVDNSVGR